MRKFCFFFIVTIFSFNLLAQDNFQTADIKGDGYILLPKEALQLNKEYSPKDLQEVYRNFLYSKRGKSLQSVSQYYGMELTSAGFAFSGPTNSAQAVKQANCYRCALGQKIAPANKDWCLNEFKLWDGTKKDAKETCH